MEKGLQICKKFYETYGKPMLQREFAEYENKIAVGLAGPGSDCLGLDDVYSRDHDWGPGFCIWVSKDTYKEIGAQIQAAYDNLPKEFEGYVRSASARGAKRVGVLVIEEFYEALLGTSDYDAIDWRMVDDANLAAAVSGEVYADGEGLFSSMREKLLQGYPAEIQYLKIAQEAAKFSQTGQYNYDRAMERGDRLTADRMLSDAMGHGMRLWHFIQNQYPYHDKWLGKSTQRLEAGPEIYAMMLRLHGTFVMENDVAKIVAKQQIEQLAEIFAESMYGEGFISDVEPYLDVHMEELLLKSELVKLSKEELVERIVRLEFEAFDKVSNEGGRASCQNDWPTFSVMRKSQYFTWNQEMLIQYYYDFDREYRLGHNLITEKYGRMMESTAPDRYEEIKEHFPELSDQKKAIIEQIVAVQMSMVEELAKEYPKVIGNARDLHTYEDNIVNTSYETYLRGEISTYSDKMLQLYGAHVAGCAMEQVNIARQTMENTARLYGYKSLDDFEKNI